MLDLHQFLMRSAFGDLPFVKHNNFIGMPHGAQPVSDHQLKCGSASYY